MGEFIQKNFDGRPRYIEPYAGGSSLAVSLLLKEHVSQIWLNDLDRAIYACWFAMIEETERFCDLIGRVPVTVEERRKQKAIQASKSSSDLFELGFSTFFLNRTNHSGILNGGMIGGKDQKGTWKIDARFNRDELIKRIVRIAERRKQIKLTCTDARRLVSSLRASDNSFVYLDPPYVGAGTALYMNAYRRRDHVFIRDTVVRLGRKWVVSYDDLPFIRKLYRGFRVRDIQLLHTAREARVGTEVLFFCGDAVIPKLILTKRPPRAINGKQIKSRKQ